MKHALGFLMPLSFALSLILSACQSGGTPDPILKPENAFGGTVPDGTTMVTPEEFKTLTTTEGFVLDTLALRQERKAKAAAQFKIDSDQVKLLEAQSPNYAKALTEPDLTDPNLTVLPDGSYQITVPSNNGPVEVVTNGKPALYRDMLESRKNFEDLNKQLEVYRLGYEELSQALKTDLPTPDSLIGANLETLLSARTALGKRLSENPLELLDAHATSANPQTRAIPSDAKPLGYPASAALEEGAGQGIDHEGSNCVTPKAGGLYQNFWWRQKFYATSIKSQGKRGSCVAFALAGALETRIAIEQSRWINLSEQFLWGEIASNWDAREYGDGASLPGSASDFNDTKYALPLEQAWNYNTARSRKDHKDSEYYSNSCDGYSESCSNASHQLAWKCTTFGGITFCGYVTPPASGPRFKQSESDTIYDWYSIFGLPVDEMRALLKNGHPMVAGLMVNEGYDHPNADGFITKLTDDHERGGHAVQIVGFIPQADILANPNLPITTKLTAALSGGGYFVIKNSWGYCMGDAGFIYAPVSWAKEYISSVTIFHVTPSAAFKGTPNSAPSIQITAPSTGSSFPFASQTTFTASATDSDGPAPSISWSSDLDGVLGTGSSISKSFNSPGTRIITATATDDKGAKGSASITVNATNVAPQVFIDTPSASAVVWANSTSVGFSSTSISGDGLLGGLPCTSLTWKSSNPSDTLGTGCSFNVVFTTTGSRTITLKGTDAYGLSGTDTVTLSVTTKPLSGPPVVKITSPVNGKQYSNLAQLLLVHTMNDPGGTPTSQYIVVWSIVNPSTESVITPLSCLIKAIPFPCFVPADYGYGNSPAKTLTLKLKVYDDEGFVGTDTVSITIGVPG